MSFKSYCCKVFFATCALLIMGLPVEAVTSESSDETDLQESIQKVIQQVDSNDFANQISNDEFIVNAYLLVNGRKPDAFEFYYCQLLFTKNKLTRSNLLALLMAGSDDEITWDKCRTIVNKRPVEFLKNIGEIRQEVQTLKNASQETIINKFEERLKSNSITTSSDINVTSANTVKSLTSTSTNNPSAAYETYNTYFGYLHAHTDYSDGEGTPAQAYQYARDSGKLDFFAVTDHGELIVFWPWQKKWKKTKAAAEAYYEAGSFVTLWGFEWSNPLLGHINIINTNKYTNCLSNVGLGDIYNWLEGQSDGFGIFNHPGDYDILGTEFKHLEMTEPEVIPQMVGIETWNDSNGFDQYYYKNVWSHCSYGYLDTGNRNGWMLGALGAQDNHDQDWGTKNEFRTAVLAKNLTRDEIIAAYQNRRFYATEDRNLYLDFRCCGYPMGSKLTDVSRLFTVTASDGGGDTFNRIRLYRNGDLIATEAVSGSYVTVSFTDFDTTAASFYYVIVTENDDNDKNGRNDEAISSPIWIQ